MLAVLGAIFTTRDIIISGDDSLFLFYPPATFLAEDCEAIHMAALLMLVFVYIGQMREC